MMELHCAIRLVGETARAKELVDRAVATGLIAGVVYEVKVKGTMVRIGFSGDMPSTSAERASAVCHIAATARELGAGDVRIAFKSHQDWLNGIGLKEVNGACERL